MNKIVKALLVSAFMISQSSSLWAASQTFTVSASIPLATAVDFTATSINSTTSARTAVSGTALNFDPMAFNTANSIWLPNHYFTVDVASSGGAGTTDVTLTYSEGTNPNAPGHGLGWKSVATFNKVVGTTETGLAAHGPKKMLKDIAGEHITPAEISGGFLRIYLGVVTKDPVAVPLDPAASEPFTNADKAGTYTGSLVITATVV